MLLARVFKNRFISLPHSFPYFVLPILSVLAWYGCSGSSYSTSNSASYPGFTQTDLVSDTASHPAASLDKDLANPWGIAIGPTGTFWIADNHKGKASLYDASGKQVSAAVTVPGAKDPAAGAPTGVVYNTTADFNLPAGGPALVIFAGEDGTLSAWNQGGSATLVANRSDSGAVYKGLALAADSGKNFLYATDFHNGRIDVYDGNFHRDTTRTFQDATLPAGYAPFNIALIGADLFVAYAKQKGPENVDDESGAGNGFINEFRTNGSLVRRFISGGHLNSPWAMVSIPGNFSSYSNGMYVGNFGDGTIDVYDSNGNFNSQVHDGSGTTIIIPGLWGLYYAASASYLSTTNRLYFTAGPDDENHGIFGYLAPL